MLASQAVTTAGGRGSISGGTGGAPVAEFDVDMAPGRGEG